MEYYLPKQRYIPYSFADQISTIHFDNVAFFAVPFGSLNAQEFFFSKVRPSSCNATDGIVTIVPTRGVPPFTYA